MIQDTDQTVCTVTYHDDGAPEADDVAADWSTAVQMAIDHLSIPDPRIKQMSSTLTIVYEEVEGKSRKEKGVSISEQPIKEEQ